LTYGMPLQVLRQLAPDVTYRSLVMLGIASIQGLSVASFEKDDADRLLFFCTKQSKDPHPRNPVLTRHPSWLIPPAPCRKRSEPSRETKPLTFGCGGENGGNFKQKLYVAAMRPIPHTRRHKMLPFSGFLEAERYDGEQTKPSLPPPPKHSVVGPAPVTHRKSLSNSYQAQQIISLNPLPLKKHGCGRSPIQACSEVDVIFKFTISVFFFCLQCFYEFYILRNGFIFILICRLLIQSFVS
jgi:hypothetical protein